MAPFTQRQVAVRAQEIVAQLLSALDREGLVRRFLNSYAKEARRPGRTANPERYRELVEAVRREALLVLVLVVEESAPSRLGIRAGARASPEQAKLLALFREEFDSALERGLSWGDEEFPAFHRDLDLYRKLYGEFRPRARGRSSGETPMGPFVDRCGILLDPAMLDLARRAAAKFEDELAAAASERLRKVFSRR